MAKTMEQRIWSSAFQTREEESAKIIEGYFAVFNSIYEMWDGCTESVEKGAFHESLEKNDIRALVDHETRLVLGRTSNQTLFLKEDDKGLWGKIIINEADQDALNLYSRVKRGDVNQCSFGFEILEESRDCSNEEGKDNVHFTLKKVQLHEVSVVTFPAYQDTAVLARKESFRHFQEERLEAWRKDQKEVITKMRRINLCQ